MIIVMEKGSVVGFKTDFVCTTVKDSRVTNASSSFSVKREEGEVHFSASPVNDSTKMDVARSVCFPLVFPPSSLAY